MTKNTKKRKTVAVNVNGRTIIVPKGVSISDGEKVFITFKEEDDGDDPRDVGNSEVFGEELDNPLERYLLAVGVNEYKDD